MYSVNVEYRVISKSFRDFRPMRYCSRDGHAEGERVNRGRVTPSFCSTLRVLDMSTLGDAADINPVIKFLPHTLHVCGRNLFTATVNSKFSRLCLLIVGCSEMWRCYNSVDSYQSFRVILLIPSLG